MGATHLPDDAPATLVPGRLAVMQNGYVVRDWRAAARHWIDVCGVGPFFAMEHLQFHECWYRGEPTALDMSVAIGYSGEHQVELVQQHGDAPSIYRDFLAKSPEGLQHVGVLVDDLDAELDRRGWRERRVQWGTTTLGQRFAYVDTELHGGSMLELIEVNEQIQSAFGYMKQAAANWDGRRPIRVTK